MDVEATSQATANANRDQRQSVRSVVSLAVCRVVSVGHESLDCLRQHGKTFAMERLPQLRIQTGWNVASISSACAVTVPDVRREQA